MMALTRLAAVLALVASSAQGHVQVQPSMVTYDTSTDITLTVPHGGEVAGTKMILVKMPPGTYATKPVPLYGFDMSVDQRELDPPRGLWGMMKNTTADTITWTGADGFVLPTWAIDYLRFTTVFTPQEGVLHFRVSQLLTDNTWLNWTVGEDNVKPVNVTILPTNEDEDEHMAHGGRRRSDTAEAPHDHKAMLASQAAAANATAAPTPAATKTSAAPAPTKAAPTSGSKQDEAPAVMVMSPEALAKYNAPKCNCDTSDLVKQLADLKAIVDRLTSVNDASTQR